MNLMPCHECGAQISTVWTHCPECGAATIADRQGGSVGRQPEGRESPSSPSTPGGTSAFACPRCGSEQVQSLSLVHSGGVTASRTIAGGIALTGGGDVGLLSGSGVTSSQSALAQRAAPPQMKPVGGLMGLGVLLLILPIWIGSVAEGAEGVLVGGAIGIALCAFCMYLAVVGPDAYNRKELPRELARWKRSFMCGRCGAFFEVDSRHLGSV